MGNVLTQFANIFSGIVFIYTETCFKKIKLLCPFTEGFYPSAFMSQHTPRDILAPSLSPFYARTLEDSQTRWGLSHFQYRRGRPSVCSAECLEAVYLIFSSSLFQHELNCEHTRAAANGCPKTWGAKCPQGARAWCHLYEFFRSPLHSQLSSPAIRSESGHHIFCPHIVLAMIDGIATP